MHWADKKQLGWKQQDQDSARVLEYWIGRLQELGYWEKIQSGQRVHMGTLSQSSKKKLERRLYAIKLTFLIISCLRCMLLDSPEDEYHVYTYWEPIPSLNEGWSYEITDMIGSKDTDQYKILYVHKFRGIEPSREETFLTNAKDANEAYDNWADMISKKKHKSAFIKANLSKSTRGTVSSTAYSQTF